MPRRSVRKLYIVGDWWVTDRADSAVYCRATFCRKRGRTVRYSLDTEDFEEAKERLHDWWNLTYRPKDAEPEQVQIVTLLLHYYEDHGRHVGDPARIRLAIDHLSDFFKGETVEDFTKGRQQAYARHRAALGIAPGTWGRELSVARAGFRWAQEEGSLRYVPRFIPLPKGGQRTRVLEPSEFRAWLDHAEPHCRQAMLIMATTCCRPSAALQLTVFQCDQKDRLVDLNPTGRAQTKKYRPVVPMSRHFAPLLEASPGSHLVMWRPERPVVSRKVEGKPPLEWRPVQSVKKAATRARERAGLDPSVTLYTIRHTMRTEMAKQGVPDAEADAFMGHIQPGTRGAYIHLKPGYLGKALAVIDDYLDRVYAPVTRQPGTDNAGKSLKNGRGERI